MIVSLQPDAVEAGANILRAGGNAVDAALACAFVQTVVDPMMCGIAGFGSMHLYLPEAGVHEFIDFHGRVPAHATSEMWHDLVLGETEDGFGFVLEGALNDIGYQSITTPGTLKAFWEAHQRYGTISWAQLLHPAIAAASNGYVVTPGVYSYWTGIGLPGRVSVEDRLGYSTEGQGIYFDQGHVKPVGSIVRNPGMAETYGRIATAGAEIFYSGDIARQIDSDMRRNKAFLSADDLADYKTERQEPLWGAYRGLRVATNHPPGGGVMVIEMLNILEHFDLKEMGHNSAEYIRTVAETMKIATADKDNYLGDPRFIDVPVDRLTSESYASGHASAISQGKRAHIERLHPPESAGTTHLCAVDHSGNVVSMTHSLGMMSGVITPGMGFMYNGCMGVFDPRPGRAGSIAPGKSRFSSICPTIIFDGDQPLLALGAPGGTQIAMGVLQVILNVVEFGMTPQEAVLAPRFSATSDVITVTARIPRYSYADLELDGYRFVRSAASYDIASVHAIGFTSGGELSGGADIVYGAGMALAV
jgi:gamma-glutamyltranspeptidase/glutathione hydrolase